MKNVAKKCETNLTWTSKLARLLILFISCDSMATALMLLLLLPLLLWLLLSRTAATCSDSGSGDIKSVIIHILSLSLSPSVSSLLLLWRCLSHPLLGVFLLCLRISAEICEQLITLRCHFCPCSNTWCCFPSPSSPFPSLPTPTIPPHACVIRHSIMAYLTRKFCHH